jgi:hypothetical protein
MSAYCAACGQPMRGDFCPCVRWDYETPDPDALPGLAIVRRLELQQPPVADVPPADPQSFTLTAPDGRVEAIGRQARFTF